MDWLLLAAFAAVIIALVSEFQAEGKSLLGWAVVVGFVGVIVTRWPT